MLRERLFGIVHTGNVLKIEKLLNTLGVIIKKNRNYILAVLRHYPVEN
jgi:hypothetical protein